MKAGLPGTGMDVANQRIVKAKEQRLSGRLDSLKLMQKENTDRRRAVIFERLLQSRAPIQQ